MHLSTLYSKESNKRAVPSSIELEKAPLQIYSLESATAFLQKSTFSSDYFYILYLQKGELKQQIGTECYIVQNPSIVIIPQGEFYALKTIQKNSQGYFIAIESNFVSSLIEVVTLSDLLGIETIIKLSNNEEKWTSNICYLLLEAFADPSTHLKIGLGLMQAFLHRIIDLSAGGRYITRQREIANHFKQLVAANYAIQKNVYFYAQELSISENYLNRCVKAQYNKSCKQIIQETAIHQSKILIQETTKNISEISFDTGFEDPSHFARIFKKITGLTPSQFRNEIMHDLSYY